MRGFLLDTNVPSELTRSRPDQRVTGWLQSVRNERLFLSAITIGEIRKGCTIMPESERRRKLERWLEEDLHPWFAAGRILPVDEAVAELWGVLDGRRQLQGAPLNTADGLIAATAVHHRLTLATRNVEDFASLGAEIFNPWLAS